MITGKVGLAAESDMAVAATVRRGLNELRLAVLGIVVGIALTVAFGVQDVGLIARVGIGISTFIVVALLFHCERSRRVLMIVGRWIVE